MLDWVKTETEKQSMGDARLNNRLANIINTLSIEPSKSIPCANTTWAETFAAYRFFDNAKVNFESIMSGHRAATLARILKESVVLIPQDTTFLNFATDSTSKDMGTLRAKDSNQQLLHTSIAISPSRVNLGVVEASMWKRPEEKAKRTRNTKPIEEKESMRWLDHYSRACDIQKENSETTIVSIADREGDIHEWFQHAESFPLNERANYIIRAKANRTLELDNDDRLPLWDYMNTQKSLGKYSIKIPKRNKEPERTALIDVYASEVHLLGKGKARRPLSQYVVFAKERNPPDAKSGIEWMLLTDFVVEDYTQAQIIIEWYRCRWEIETYFRVIKGSCGIQDNRLQTESRMLNCIAVYLIIGWRLHAITMLAREDPDRQCTDAFSDREWTILWRMRNKTPPPKDPPCLRDITRMLANLGGFLGRKGDGEPGVQTIWKGYDKLLHYIEAADHLGL